MVQINRTVVKLDAFQMTFDKKKDKDGGNWPDWFGWELAINKPGAVFSREEKDGVYLKTLQDDIELVVWDSWIIKGEFEEIFVISPEEFAAKWEVSK